jgi:ABC-2 type transport system ATP-binding protein
MTTPGPVLAASELALTYRTRDGRTVGLRGATLEVAPGEWLALLGPNGSGKSTLLALASTSLSPASGSLTIAGIPLSASADRSSLRRARALVGVAFQTPALDPLLTVSENLRTAAALMGLRGTDALRRIDVLLGEFRLTDRARDRVGTLSGGLQRRTDLARAVLGSPRLLVLDEPTTGLDPDARRDLLSVLEGLRCGEVEPDPVAILSSTHLIDEAEHADRVALLDEGRIAAVGTPAELRRRAGETAVTVHGCAPGDAETLRKAGLDPEPRPGGRLIASLGGADAREVAGVLHASGLAFSVAPPTLADAYEVIVGRSLDRDSTTDRSAP